MAQKEFLASGRAHINDLISRVQGVTDGLTDAQLSAPDPSGAWGIGQILEHLNLAHGAYLEAGRGAMEHPVRDAAIGPISLTFFGNMLTRMAGPEGNAPVPKPLIPISDHYSSAVVDQFVSIHRSINELISEMGDVDIMSTKFRNPFIPLIRMSLADLVEIVSLHGERHVRQIEERLPAILKVD